MREKERPEDYGGISPNDCFFLNISLKIRSKQIIPLNIISLKKWSKQIISLNIHFLKNNGPDKLSQSIYISLKIRRYIVFFYDNFPYIKVEKEMCYDQ
jgi:hypothetical protein